MEKREEIMMEIGNVDNIIIREKYDDDKMMKKIILNIKMEYEGVRKNGKGK
jgi:hypothetical protein